MFTSVTYGSHQNCTLIISLTYLILILLYYYLSLSTQNYEREKGKKTKDGKLTTIDGVFKLGPLLVLTRFTLAEEEPTFVEILATSGSGTDRIYVIDAELKKVNHWL